MNVGMVFLMAHTTACKYMQFVFVGSVFIAIWEWVGVLTCAVFHAVNCLPPQDHSSMHAGNVSSVVCMCVYICECCVYVWV